MNHRATNVSAFCLAVAFLFAVPGARLEASITASANCTFSQSLSASPASIPIGGSFDLSWCDPSYFISSDAAFGVDSFSVYYSKSPQGPWTLVRQVTPPTTAVRLTTDSSDSPVVYLYVKAVGCTITIAGGCPPNPRTELQSNIVAVNVGSTAACQFDRSLRIAPSLVPIGQPFTLQWCDPSFASPGGSLAIDFFRVLYGPSPSGPWTPVGDLAGKTAVSLVPTGGDEGTIYFKIEAWGCGGGANTSAAAVCSPATKQLESNVVLLTVSQIFTASPASIAAGQSTTLLWSAPAGSTVTISDIPGTQQASGAVVVSPAQTKTYTLTAVSAQRTITVQTTVEVITQPLVVVSSFPRGLAQSAGAGGSTDRIVLTNIGGSATTVNVIPSGGFFTASPLSLNIDRGASATINLQANAQPAGVQSGSVAFTGNGVPSNLSVPVRLLSIAPAAGTVVPRSLQSRVDISSTGSGLVSGSVTFRNDGSATLQGIAVSDAAWLQPENGLITIGPNGSRAVSFTIDPTRRSAALPASENATLKLVAAPGQSGPAASASVEDATGQTTGGASIVHTSRTTVTQTNVPPFVPGQLGYFVTALPHSSTLIGELLALNGPNNEKRLDVSLYYLAAGAAASLGRLASFPSVSPNSLILLADIVKTLFNDDGAFSTVQVRASQIDNLSVAANLLQTGDARGLLGSPLPATRSDRAVTRSALPGVRKTTTANTSIYVQEASGAATRVRTDFLNESGAALSSRTDDIGAFALLEEKNAVPDGAAAAVVSVLAGGNIIARGLTSDSSSGDITDILDWSSRNGIGAADAQYVPYARKGQSAAGPVTTELVVFNAGSTSLNGTLSYRGSSGSSGQPCAQTSTTMCLSGGRFAVSATFRDNGVLKDATAIKYTDGSGLFWFFGADNIEILMKVLNACGLNSKFWVFSAATTNVEFHLKVVDTNTGATKIYDNPAGPPAPAITDTSAFSCTPPEAMAEMWKPWLSEPAATNVAVTLAPQQSRTFTDVLSSLGAGNDSTGYIVFAPTAGSASITARVNTSAGGTLSAAVPVVGSSQLLRKAQSVYFSGLEDAGQQAFDRKQPGTFRIGLALAQPEGSSSKVRVTTYFTPGLSAGRTVQRAVATKEYALTQDKPLVIGNLMRDLIGPVRDTLDDLHNVQIDVVVLDGDGAVIPLIISTENATGDTFLRAE